MDSIVLRLQNTTMYRLMLYYMVVLVGVAVILSAVGVLPYNAWDIVLQTVFFVLVCWAVNRVIARLLKIKPNKESSLITGLILSALAGPLALPSNWLVLVVMAVAAMASKYFLVVHRSHIFNPAAFGVVVSALVLDHSASWWLGTGALWPIVLIGGVLLMRKIRRWHLIVSFLSVYLGLLALYTMFILGRGIADTANLIQGLLTSSPLLFFAFVMLIEPLTAPQTTKKRVAFGVVVAVVLFTLQRLTSSIPFSLELSLLIGNMFARIVSPDFRQALVLRRKEFFSPAIGSFWLEPTRAFAYFPGQFLEYTLGHSRADARGVRRFFTIASSPTEKQVLLTSRFSEGGSTFKQALRNMKEGEEIMASKVGGDFVVPTDTARKLTFIAGGIGVTPFRSIVKYVLDMNQSRDIVLIYAARQERDLVFRDLFEEARTTFGMRTVYVLSDAARISSTWQGRVGMIDATVIQEEIPDFHDRLFYVSGPEPMVQSMIKILTSMNIPRHHIKRDFFPGYES